MSDQMYKDIERLEELAIGAELPAIAKRLRRNLDMLLGNPRAYDVVDFSDSKHYHTRNCPMDTKPRRSPRPDLRCEALGKRP